MVLYGPPDIKFSVQIPKSPFGDIENFTKLAHDPIPPYHSVELYLLNGDGIFQNEIQLSLILISPRARYLSDLI